MIFIIIVVVVISLFSIGALVGKKLLDSYYCPICEKDNVLVVMAEYLETQSFSKNKVCRVCGFRKKID